MPELAVPIGAEIKRLRMEADLTQLQLAQAIGSNRQALIAGIEAGQPVRLATLLAVAYVLDVTDRGQIIRPPLTLAA